MKKKEIKRIIIDEALKRHQDETVIKGIFGTYYVTPLHNGLNILVQKNKPLLRAPEVIFCVTDLYEAELIEPIFGNVEIDKIIKPIITAKQYNALVRKYFENIITMFVWNPDYNFDVDEPELRRAEIVTDDERYNEIKKLVSKLLVLNDDSYCGDNEIRCSIEESDYIKW